MIHWSRANYFSGTGIDLFKAYDTTRIFILTCNEKKMNSLEWEILNIIDKRYTLNVFSGGSVDYHIENNLPLMETVEMDDFIGNIVGMFQEVEELKKKFIVQ